MPGTLQNRPNHEHWAKHFLWIKKLPLWAPAKEIGCSYPYLSHVLNGTIIPSEEIENKIRNLVHALTGFDSGDSRDERTETYST